MFKDNLVSLRKLHDMTQEDLADIVGVTRQAVAKWESGETVPDLEKSRAIANAFGVTIDDLINHEPTDNLGLGIAPRGKHLFGIVTVGDKGQIVIPAKARKIFEINPGDSLVVLGDEGTGIALMKSDGFLKMADKIRRGR
ncbi:looped-hinge helix DNA binding domain-containing protein, AbrB family [Ruminococcaceae bacterium KH2T8]|nr:looped-hinge helix DNA binding domain-containing protein, AbrB family [Ruminococcaceae bacterium KH2T8]